MKRYRVIVSPRAHDQIERQTLYIGRHSGSARIARQWATRVYAAIDRLDHFPYRFDLAEEDVFRDYAIHRVVVGNCIVLYTVDEEATAVRVIGFRHGARLPRPNELPSDPADEST